MIFKRANTMTREIKNKMQEYGILKFEKDYSMRISNNTKSKIKNLSQSEAFTLLAELKLWTKQYLVDNIYKMAYDVHPSIYYQFQSEFNDRLIQEFLLRGMGKTGTQIKSVKRLIEIPYIDLLMMAEDASKIYLNHCSKNN